MVYWCETCYGVDQEFTTLDQALEHVQKEHSWIDLRTPEAAGYVDDFGHQWYCYTCTPNNKTQVGFNSSEALMKHLVENHGGCGLRHREVKRERACSSPDAKVHVAREVNMFSVETKIHDIPE